MKPRAFLADVRRYWKAFAIVAGAVFAVALLSILRSPVKYVSTTQLMVSISGSTTAAAYQNDEVVTSRVNSYIALLTSDVVSQRVVDSLGLSLTAPELASRVSATRVPPNTSIIDVAVRADSPQGAEQIANAFADEFIAYTTAIETPTGEDEQKVHVTTVTSASRPQTNVGERGILTLLAAVLATILGAVAVWIRSVTDPVVRTADRARAAAGVPVLGVVPVGPAHLLAELGPYRRLRAALTVASGATGGRVVEITSTDATQNTPDVAANLAYTLQATDHRCVVCDLSSKDAPADAPRRGGDGAAISRPNRPDDAESSGDSPADDNADHDHDQNDDADALSHPKSVTYQVVDTVSLAESTAEQDLAATNDSADRIRQLRAEYDYVLIAAPQVLPHGSALSDYADEVLILCTLNTTRRIDLSRAADALRATGAPLVGVVVVIPTEQSVREP